MLAEFINAKSPYVIINLIYMESPDKNK
jgi:hypothetical protein